MASVILGSSISAISGKVGGSVYQKNTQGLFIRGNSIKNASSNPSIVAQNTYFAFLTSVWNSLTVDELSTWQYWAPYYSFNDKLGRPFHPTPYQLFIHCNHNLYESNAPVIRSLLTGGVTYAVTAFPSVISKTLSQALLTVSYALPVGYMWKFYITSGFKHTKSFSHPRWAARVFEPHTISTGYNAFNDFNNATALGLQIGQKIYLSSGIIYLATGTYNETSRDSFIII